MALKELTYPSLNQRDVLEAWVCTPLSQPRAVIQWVHGFGEHSRRALSLLLALSEAGFVVCANDHAGHGKTAYQNGFWCCFGTVGATPVADERRLHTFMMEDYGDLPWFMFGQGWGSIVARDYAARYGSSLAGCLLCGTYNMAQDADALAAELKQLVETGEGGAVEPEYWRKMRAGLTDRIEKVSTPDDWLSDDADIVSDFIKDPLNCFNNTPDIQTLYELTHLSRMVSGLSWAKKIPTQLPIYNMAGAQDPVGKYGEDVQQVSRWLEQAGCQNVQTKLYEGFRHDIYTDRRIRREVMADMIGFIENSR